MKIFDNKIFTPFMYISISLISLLILFSFVNLVEDKEFDITNLVRFAPPIEYSEEITDSVGLQEELYSEKSYFIYYSILFVLSFCIVLLALRYIFPYFKNYT